MTGPNGSITRKHKHPCPACAKTWECTDLECFEVRGSSTWPLECHVCEISASPMWEMVKATRLYLDRCCREYPQHSAEEHLGAILNDLKDEMRKTLT